MYNNIEFIKILQSYCKENNITAYKLSKLTGISITYSYRLLKGEMNNPSLSIINKITRSLDIKI